MLCGSHSTISASVLILLTSGTGRRCFSFEASAECEVSGTRHGGTQEVQAYWGAELQKVDSPSAKALLPLIDVTQPLGIDLSKAKKPLLHGFFQEQKLQRPTMMLLVRASPQMPAAVEIATCCHHACSAIQSGLHANFIVAGSLLAPTV